LGPVQPVPPHCAHLAEQAPVGVAEVLIKCNVTHSNKINIMTISTTYVVVVVVVVGLTEVVVAVVVVGLVVALVTVVVAAVVVVVVVALLPFYIWRTC
jgi:hypothetical protein